LWGSRPTFRTIFNNFRAQVCALFVWVDFGERKWSILGFSRNFRAGQGALGDDTATAAAT
jgi:hypothetical protein